MTRATFLQATLAAVLAPLAALRAIGKGPVPEAAEITIEAKHVNYRFPVRNSTPEKVAQIRAQLEAQANQYFEAREQAYRDYVLGA